MSQNFGNLLRFAIENSQGPPASISNPEDAAWLKEALSASCVDPVKQMIDDINGLKTLLLSADPATSEIDRLMEDLLTLTEDLDLANDFFKVGGTELLLTLLFNEPSSSIREDALQLLANLTQNNPEAQRKCHEKDILPRLLLMLEEQEPEKNAGYAANLILGVSCLIRNSPSGISIFRESKGFTIVIDLLNRVVSSISDGNKEQIQRLLAKSSFLIFGILQDISSNSLTDSERQNLSEQIISLLMKIRTSQEYLLASLILLITKCANTEEAIPKLKSMDKQSLKLSIETTENFSAWMVRRRSELEKLDDSANAELQSYIEALQHIF